MSRVELLENGGRISEPPLMANVLVLARGEAAIAFRQMASHEVEALGGRSRPAGRVVATAMVIVLVPTTQPSFVERCRG